MSIGVAVRHHVASIVDDVVDAIDRAEGMHVVPEAERAMVVLAGGEYLRETRANGLVVLSSGDEIEDVRAGFEAGATGWVRWPDDAKDLGRVVAHAVGRLKEPDAPGGQVVAVVGARGGAGASTVACLLAASKDDSLIVDLEGGQRAWAPDGVRGDSLERALAAPLPDVIANAAEPHAAGRALYGDGSPTRTGSIGAVIDAARLVTSLVVVDAPSVDGWADRTVLVCGDDLASLRAARRMLDAGAELDVILNRFRPRAIRSAHVERALGRKPIGVLRRDLSIARTADLGQLPGARLRKRVAGWLS